MAKKVGARFALACASGTAALHLAALAAGFKKGDKILVPAVTFLSSANAALFTGAEVQFVDISNDDYNIDLDLVEKACRRDAKIKGVIPVHFAGHPCDMGRLSKIARKHKLVVIEDAAHALGASYNVAGKVHKVGSSTHSAMTALSFHPVKHITTGEGGMVLTGSAPLRKKLGMLRFHGITKDKGEFRNKRLPGWHFEMQMLGYNYFLTDFQCALGLSQLKKLDFFVKRRRRIAKMYNEGLSEVEEIILPAEKKGFTHSYHIYVIRVRSGKLAGGRDALFDELQRRGILVHLHYEPVYRHPYYKKRYGFKAKDFPGSERYFRTALTLPVFPGMSDGDVLRVVRELKSALRRLKK